MQDELGDLRAHIDKVDAELVRLLNDRAATAITLGKLKARTGKTVYDPARERAVLDNVDQLNKGPLSKGAIEELFAAIITACREIQAK